MKNRSLVPILVDVPTLASNLAISERHVRRLVAERRIPFIKVGSRVRFDVADVLQFVNEARVAVAVIHPLLKMPDGLD